MDYMICAHRFKRDDRGTYCIRCGLTPTVDASGAPIEAHHHHRIWSMVRQRGYERCFWCRLLFHAERPPTRDHIVPINHGGTLSEGLVFSCQTCNSARGNVAFDIYLAAVDAERERAKLERREYRRPKWRKVGNEWVLTAMTRAELRATRAS